MDTNTGSPKADAENRAGAGDRQSGGRDYDDADIERVPTRVAELDTCWMQFRAAHAQAMQQAEAARSRTLQLFGDTHSAIDWQPDEGDQLEKASSSVLRQLVQWAQDSLASAGARVTLPAEIIVEWTRQPHPNPERADWGSTVLSEAFSPADIWARIMAMHPISVAKKLAAAQAAQRLVTKLAIRPGRPIDRKASGVSFELHDHLETNYSGGYRIEHNLYSTLDDLANDLQLVCEREEANPLVGDGVRDMQRDLQPHWFGHHRSVPLGSTIGNAVLSARFFKTSTKVRLCNELADLLAVFLSEHAPGALG